MKPSVYIVVAAYNESRAIRNALGALTGRGWEVVVVDDGSSDGTGEAIRGLGAHVLRHPVNLGQGAALQTGTAYALAQGADVIVHFDADGQHSGSDMEGMLAPILAGEADVVLGSRFLREGDSEEVPGTRRAVLRGARLINGLLTGLWLTDAHNGFRAFSAAAAARIDLRENRMAHASEILLQVRRQGLRWVERPTRITYTEYSREKGQPALNGVRIVVDLVLRRIFR